MTDATYTFLPWVRRGVAGGIAKPDDLGATAPARAEVAVTLTVATDDPNTSAEPAMTVRLYGPGDVVGFDPRQVIRVEPAHLTPDFEPNYFPAVEFDRPDFPWMFTPLAASPQGRLRPWLCLVAVRKREGVRLETKPGRPLPVLSLDAAAQELPDLADSWSWAHVQVAGSYGATALHDVLAGEPERHTARLLCPRKLQDTATYLACVVPTFKVGRQAGLGETVADEATLEPAWTPSDQKLDLPVYYHWEFTTGAAGDFEALARLLEPRRLPPEVGIRPMDVSAPGGGLPPLPDSTDGAAVGLEGALRNPDLDAEPRPWPPLPDFRNDLTPILLAPWALLKKESEEAPVVVPPLYGQWHAAFGRNAAGRPPAFATDAPPWLGALNLDPRHRAAAGIGTQIVRDQQEHLMASAWEQVGEIERANQKLRQGQLAREAGGSLYRRHLEALPIVEFVLVAGPVQSRVLLDGRTFAGHVAASCLPPAALAAPARRLLRPRGPLARRLGRRDGSLARQLVSGLADGSLTPIPPRRLPAGTTLLEEFRNPIDPTTRRRTDLPAYADILANLLKQRDPNQPFAVAPERRPPITPNPDRPETVGDVATAERFRQAAEPHLRRLAARFGLPAPAPKPVFDLDGLGKRLLQAVDPRRTVPRLILDQVRLPDGLWSRLAELEPIMAAPRFPQPMYEPLRDLSQDLLLPGIDRIPPNTVTVAETNPRFVEAYLVGLNHELARELLWRGFPTDQRGSYFRQFWDPRGRWPAPQDPEDVKDVPPLDRWEEALGQHLLGAGEEGRLVLMIRGELLKRYPNCAIYAQPALWPATLPNPFPPEGTQPPPPPPPRDLDETAAPKAPIFRGTLAPDITFLGFDLSEADARGLHPSLDRTKPGWFFVLQQQPTEPRFGLDATSKQPAPTTLADIAWTHVNTTGAGYLDAEETTSSLRPIDPNMPVDPRWRAWGGDATTPTGVHVANAAHAARAALQSPVRIAIHADDMLPPK